MRRGFRPTSWIVRSLPGTRAAAASSGAADEKSPGTSTSPSRSEPAGWTVIEVGPRRTGTPAPSSMSSVWSRVGAGSTTVVWPPALIPASSTADFTCALATGSSYVSPRSASEPSITSGAWPSVVAISAPICLSGSAIRSIGLELSDSSPVSSKRPDCPATIPASRRISVPALAQSTGPARRPRSPTPRTYSSSCATSSTLTPSARTAETVASVSADRPKPRTSVSPSPIAPSSTARCEIDLSPGTATWPVS